MKKMAKKKKPIQNQPVDTSEVISNKTNAERLTDVEARLDQAVQIINNLIAFCNTLERWRTLPFKTQEQVDGEQRQDDVDFNDETHKNGTPKSDEEVPATTSE